MTVNELIKFLQVNFKGNEQIAYTLYTDSDIRELCKDIYEELTLTDELINELFENIVSIDFESMCEYIEENFLN